MHTSNDDITAEGADRWRIRAERRQGDQVGTGEAVVREAGQAHTSLAGGRAWHTLASARLAAGDPAAALAAARAGLAELGDRYSARSMGVIDDTNMHIAKADDQVASGAVSDAARRMVEVLAQRLAMYARLHAATLAE